MTAREPTVLFDVIETLADLAGSIEWPTLLAESGEVLNKNGVTVVFGELVENSDGTVEFPAREFVAVTGSVDDDRQDTWPEKGLNTKTERFSTTVVIATAVPNRKAREAWRRNRALVQAFDAALRDMTTGRPIIPQNIALLGVTSWSVSSVNTTLLPSPDGFISSSAVGVSVSAHI